MKNELIKILGLNKNAKEHDIINEVLKLRNELSEKTGYHYSSFLQKMKRLGLIEYIPQENAYVTKVIKFTDKELEEEKGMIGLILN